MPLLRPAISGPQEVPRWGTEPLPHLLTIEQLAEHLGVTRHHVRRLLAEKRVPYFKWRSFIRFDPAEIGAWLDKHTASPKLDAIRDVWMTVVPEPLRLFDTDAVGVRRPETANEPLAQASLQRPRLTSRLFAKAQDRFAGAVLSARSGGCGWRGDRDRRGRLLPDLAPLVWSNPN